MVVYARTLFLTLGVLALFVNSSLAQEKVRFATHFKLSPYHVLPVIASMENGYWQEQGIAIEWFPLDGGTATAQAIVAGAVDVGTNSSLDVILGIPAGVQAIIVADLGYHSYFSVWVLADSPLRKPEDLKGAKIATLRAGGLAHTIGLALLKALGLEGQVKLVAVGGGAQLVAALKARATEANIHAITGMAPLVVKGEVRQLIRIYDHLPVVDWVGIFARKDFAEQKAELVKRAIRAFLKGTRFVMDNKEWSLSRMEKDFKFSREAAELLWKTLGYSKTGAIEEDKIKVMVKFLVDYGLIAQEKVPPMGKIYTNRYLP